MSPMVWLIISLITLVLFGNRLPSAMRSLGRGLVEFKRGMAEFACVRFPERLMVSAAGAHRPGAGLPG
jgi:TatA/E family protein of Tat protein translocase